MKSKLLNLQDWILAAIATVVSFVVYFLTTAPNVTLLDSGEFVLAAQHFGIPHPTGYPLWTLGAWLFQLLPLGNAAWEVALFSGVCGAAAVGVCTLLLSSTLRWALPDAQRVVLLTVPLAGGLLFAFSEPMWSQAVIAEVYTLHALLIGLYLFALYGLIREPESDFRLLLAFFLLTLAFSNHHLTLVLVPLPFLVILLQRPRRLPDLLVFSVLTAVLYFLLFALLSEDQRVLKTAIRFAYIGFAAFVILLWAKRLKVEWRLLAFLPLVVAIGLLPYLYLPIASSTNPPMNWGYPRTMAGFYYSFNRSQYPNSLSTVIVGSVGKLLGTAPGESPDQAKGQAQESAQLVERASGWTAFFWLKLAENFTGIYLIGFAVALIFLLRAPPEARYWIYVLNVALALAAFVQPVREGTLTDFLSWWTQKPLHTYTFLIFTLLSSIGVAYLFELLSRRVVIAGLASITLLFLPVVTFLANYDSSSQRDRWFGYRFGYDMLADLPEGAVIFGGTDAGRFIPTYMILGESTQPTEYKRNPDFDRRDLYIITQNALADAMYQNYIHSHYTSARARELTGFEKWLERDEQYPEAYLALPDAGTVKALIQNRIARASEENVLDQPESELAHSAIAKWIFEQNKEDHTFYVEESFPMAWSYDYALPDGLLMRLAPEPIEEIPDEVVARDFAFWAEYIERLKSDPGYENDFDAQRAFSKLRHSIGNLYRYREMNQEAEAAYRQALELWPSNAASAIYLIQLLWEREEVDEPVDLITQLVARDPHNDGLFRFAVDVVRRQQLQGEISELEEQIERNPQQQESLKELLRLLGQVGDTNRISELVAMGEEQFGDDPQFLSILVGVYSQLDDDESVERILRRVSELDSDNPAVWLNLARFYARQDRPEEVVAPARRAIALGGFEAREAILEAEELKQLQGTDVFEKIFVMPALGQVELAPAPSSTSEAEATSETGGQEQNTLRSP